MAPRDTAWPAECRSGPIAATRHCPGSYARERRWTILSHARTASARLAVEAVSARHCPDHRHDIRPQHRINSSSAGAATLPGITSSTPASRPRFLPPHNITNPAVKISAGAARGGVRHEDSRTAGATGSPPSMKRRVDAALTRPRECRGRTIRRSARLRVPEPCVRHWARLSRGSSGASPR
jgi:hypothetical protein